MENVGAEFRETLKKVNIALHEKGYDATAQLAGYLISGDPTYITNHNDARRMVTKLDRFEIIRMIIEYYIINMEAIDADDKHK